MEDRTILEQFPLPLARGYRRYLNATESKERHDLGYFLFEIYLKYLSASAIAAYLASPERDHRVNAALKGLLRPSLGEWLRFLRECLEFAGSREDSDPVTRSIAVLFKEKDSRAPRCLELFNRMRSFRTDQPSEKEAIHLEGFLEELVAFRNRTLGHGAPLGGDHYRDFGDLFGPAFAELLDRSPFLTARRLVSFESTRVEEGSWVECSVIEFMGNQPVRRQKPHRVRYGEPVPREKLLHLLSVDMGAGESSGLLAIDPLLVAHREDVYVLNEARGVPEYISYSTGEHHRPSDLGGKQGELFEKILGYRVDETRMSQMGDELASTAEQAASLDAKDGEKRLGDYRIVREVGRGAMGIVFEAFQESLGRRVALKVLPGSFALDPRRLERFRREARATARVHHPSIVPVYEVGESGGTHYYSMEFVDGASLEDLLTRARKEAETKGARRRSSSGSDPAAVAGTVERMASLAEGLEEAHRLGLIHRDVKPSNILVEGGASAPEPPSMPVAGLEGRCVLVDFGLVHEVEAQTLTRSGEMVGTLGYMSPEQVSKGKVDARADVYSLGVTLYEVLTLRTPFDGKSEHEVQRAILFEEPLPPRRHNPRLHRDLETIVLKCMEKNPERRYASAGALAKDLRRFLRYEPIEARPQSALSRLGNRAWKHRRSLGVTGITVVLLLSVLFFGFVSQKEARLRREAEYGPRILAALAKIDQTDLSQISWNNWTNTRSAQEGETSTGLWGSSQVLAEVIEALGNETKSVPERPEAYYHRARVLRLANRDDEALADLAQVTSIDEGFVPALILEAEILEKRGEEEKAATLRERARSAGKGSWKEKWIDAQAALQKGLWADADRLLGEIIALEAEGGEAYVGASFLTWLGRGRARLEAKDFLNAVKDFAVVEAKLPEAREAFLLEGKAYHLLGQKRDAAAVFEKVHAKAPPARKDEVALAVSQILCWQDPKAALEWCAKVKLEFLREEARVLILFIAGRTEDAVQAGERAIAINSDYAPTYADLAWALTNLGRYTKAIRYSRKAIELRPRDAFMRLFSLGYAFRGSGRNVEAMAAYEEVLGLDPTRRERAIVHTFMASILEGLGDSESAEEHHRKAKDLQPFDLHGLLDRGQFLASHGKEDEALAEFDRAISVDRTYGAAYVEKGKILEKKGKPEEAMAAYRTATEVFDDGTGHLELGRLLEGQGKFDEALAGYARRLEIMAGPSNRDTHFAAHRLLGRGDVSLSAAGLERLVAVLEAALPFEGEYPELLRTLALARSRLPGTPDLTKTLEPIRAALARKGGKDPALSLVLGETLLRGARPGEALAVLEAAARHPHATAFIARTASECRKALLPGLATPASVEEALAAREREVLVPEDAVWRYFPGTREPSEGLHWTAHGFDDGSWKEGKSGFGYGYGDYATVLEDMKLGYSTLYIRRKLTVADLGRYERLVLSLRVDDGAVVYLNGVEAGRTRAGRPGVPLPHDAFGSYTKEPVAVEFSIEPSRLVPGDNVLAIQGLNNTRQSSDFSLIPGLLGELPRDPARTGKLLEALKTRPEGEQGSGLLAFLEGLLLLEEGKRTEAAGKLELAARAFPKDPLPHLRLAECLRAAGDTKAAEAALRRAIEGGLEDCREAWDLWAAVSLADLKRSPAEILADWPKVPGAEPAGSGESGPVADLRWLLETLARGDGIRIDCGGEDYVAKDGRAWSRDRFFRSGLLNGENTGHPYAFTLGIERTDDDPLYQTERWFPADHSHAPGYRIALPPGEYQVTLHFAEVFFWKRGSRSFGALLEGREVLTQYEPLEAGFATAETKTFRTRVDDGLLDIEFVRAADNPMVSAIEIQRLP